MGSGFGEALMPTAHQGWLARDKETVCQSPASDGHSVDLTIRRVSTEVLCSSLLLILFLLPSATGSGAVLASRLQTQRQQSLGQRSFLHQEHSPSPPPATAVLRQPAFTFWPQYLRAVWLWTCFLTLQASVPSSDCLGLRSSTITY